MPQMSVPTLPGLGPYKIDIQQGNVITQEMLDKLQPGMTRSQVRFVLGTPLLIDPFRTDRWDYFYSMKKRGALLEQRQLKVFFQDDKMVRYEGDIVTDSRPGAEAVATAKPAAKPVEKPVAVPVIKAEPVIPAPSQAVAATSAAQPEIAKPGVPSAPAREAAADGGKPQLQMVPGPGEPAKPEDFTPPASIATTPAATPREPESLDAPPLPRLILPPEPVEPSSPVATTPDTPATPAAATVSAKPETKPTEKPPAGPGFFGRLFGRSPSQPAQPNAAPEVKPAAAPVPAPVVAPAPVEKPVAAKPEQKPTEKPPAGPGFFGRLLGRSPSQPAQPGAAPEIKPAAVPVPAPVVAPAPVEKPVAAKPEQKPAEKPPAERGFFGRMLDGMRQPGQAIRYPGRRSEAAEPGSPPAPFEDPIPAPAEQPSAAKP